MEKQKLFKICAVVTGLDSCYGQTQNKVNDKTNKTNKFQIVARYVQWAID